jgi:hypothetical protein
VVRRGGAPRRRQHYGGRRRPALVPIVPRSQAEGEAQWNLTEMTGGQRSPIGVVNNGDGFDSIERGGASAVGVDNTSPWSRSGGYGGVHSREATQMKIRVREELGGVGRGESPEWISPGGRGGGRRRSWRCVVSHTGAAEGAGGSGRGSLWHTYCSVRGRERRGRVVEARRLPGGPHQFEIQTDLKTKTRSNVMRSKTDLSNLKKFE